MLGHKAAFFFANLFLLIEASDQSEEGIKILFGSCNAPFGLMTGIENDQPLWDPILREKADAFVWLGDVIYSDSTSLDILLQRSSVPLKPVNVSDWPPDSDKPAQLRWLYNYQKQYPGYKRLINSQTHILGTWDDHDFGQNDADDRFSWKEESQEAFLDFLNVPTSSGRRKQKGVYWREDMSINGLNVAFLLLDTRSGNTQYEGENAKMLSVEQWDWLEKQLSANNEDVDLILICSSTQVISAVENPTRVSADRWNSMPWERKRIIKLILDSKAPALILSGDKHQAELNHLICVKDKGNLVRDMWDVTSSGLTHSLTSHEKLFGVDSWAYWPIQDAFWAFVALLLNTRGRLTDILTPNRFLARSFSGLNFGMIEVFTNSTLKISVRTESNSIGATKVSMWELPIVIRAPLSLLGIQTIDTEKLTSFQTAALKRYEAVLNLTESGKDVGLEQIGSWNCFTMSNKAGEWEHSATILLVKLLSYVVALFIPMVILLCTCFAYRRMS